MSPPATGLGPGAEARAVSCEDGSELHYSVAGSSGTHIICVNAHGQDLLIFSRVIEHLARSHRVVAWKPRGTFDGARPAMTIHGQVADLRRIVDAEHVRECALITWCAGAKVAIEFARGAPEVRSLILTNGTYKTYPGLEHAETEFEETLFDLCKAVVATPDLAPMVMDSMRTLLGGSSRATARSNGASAAKGDPALAALIVEPFQSPETTRRYAAQVVDYLSHDISGAIAALEQPVLVLSGQEDRVSSPVMARAIADKLRRGTFTAIPGGSHYCLYEKAPEAMAVVESFLGPKSDAAGRRAQLSDAKRALLAQRVRGVPRGAPARIRAAPPGWASTRPRSDNAGCGSSISSTPGPRHTTS